MNENQKKTTDEYRNNWDQIFKNAKLLEEKMKKQIEEYIAQRKAEAGEETTENNELNIVQE